MSNVRGFASAAAFQRRRGAAGLGASGGASLWRNDGAAVSHSGDFGRSPRRTDFGWGALLVGAMVDVEGELSEKAACGDDSAAVLAPFYTEGG